MLTSTAVSRVKEAALEHAPVTTEEAFTEAAPEAVTDGSDPTTTHAGLTELQEPQTNGIVATEETGTAATQTEGNVAGESWDSTTGAAKENIEDNYEVVPRPNCGGR